MLVVDDEPETLTAVQGLLEYLGYQVAVAPDGKEALAKYRTLKPDAVLMDINMPAMGGVACIKEILQYDSKAKISIFTGYNQEIVDELSHEARSAINDFIPKPVGLESLSTSLAKMLRKE